jgi:hypothetical protein
VYGALCGPVFTGVVEQGSVTFENGGRHAAHTVHCGRHRLDDTGRIDAIFGRTQVGDFGDTFRTVDLWGVLRHKAREPATALVSRYGFPKDS